MSGLNLCFLSFFCRQKKVDTRSASADAEDGEILAGRASLAYRTPEAPEKKNIASDRDGWVQNRSKSACVVVRRFTTRPEGQPEQQRGPLLEVGWMPSRDTRKLTLCRIDCRQQSPSIVQLFDSRRADNSRSGHET